MGAHPVHRLPQQARRHQPAPEATAVLVGRLEGHPGQQEAVTVGCGLGGRLTAARSLDIKRPARHPEASRRGGSRPRRRRVNKFEIHT